MKNVKLPILGLSLVLLVTSCKKDDFKEDSASEITSSVEATDAVTLNWKTPTQWEKADQGTFSVHYFTIADSSITADVADNGLVLVFKKAGNNINSLPFEEGKVSDKASDNATASANYWYHQVSEGSLLVSYDEYNTPANPETANSFQYFVITPEKLNTLQSDGYTTEKLMGLSYAEAANLLKTTN